MHNLSCIQDIKAVHSLSALRIQWRPLPFVFASLEEQGTANRPTKGAHPRL